MTGTTRTRRAALATLAAATLTGGLLATAPTASAADTQRVRVVSANVNFGASASTVRTRFDNYSTRADIVLLQEVKNVNLHTLLNTDTWIVRQYVGSDKGKQGSAVVVRRTAVNRGSDVSDVQLRYGTDSSGGGSNCSLLPRYIAHVSVKLKNGGVIRPASAHLPPGDCQDGPNGPYERMIKSIKTMSDNHPGRLLVGGDWNKAVKSDPNDLSARTNGRILPRAIAGDIDGFYKPKALGQDGSVREVGFASKGHDAVQLIVNVPSTF